MQEIMIKETQSLIDRREENSVDKNNKRESLIQSKEIDEEEHVLFSYHIKTLNDLIYWVNKNVAAIESMLIEIRKKNVEINNLYNVIINERARYQVKYERLKKRVEELEDQRESVDEHENAESLDVFVESVRNASIKVDVFVMTIVATSKKLFDSLILLTTKIRISKIDYLLWEINWKKTLIDSQLRQAKKRTYVFKSMKTQWSI